MTLKVIKDNGLSVIILFSYDYFVLYGFQVLMYIEFSIEKFLICIKFSDDLMSFVYIKIFENPKSNISNKMRELNVGEKNKTSNFSCSLSLLIERYSTFLESYFVLSELSNAAYACFNNVTTLLCI